MLPAAELLPSEILRLTLPVLREEHGDARLKRTMAQFFLPQYKHVPVDQWPPDAKKCCEAPRPTFRDFVDDLRYEADWKPDPTYRGLARGSGCNGLLSACYGVANVKQLRGLERARSAFFEPTWYHVFNFIWLGWSPGGLHFDEMDNVLVQVAAPETPGAPHTAPACLPRCHRRDRPRRTPARALTPHRRRAYAPACPMRTRPDH